jgi:hypothetical protein
MKIVSMALVLFTMSIPLRVTSALGADENNPAKPGITITEMPNSGPGEGPLEPISGKVSGVKPDECKVVIYAYGDMWYVQPYANEPYTEIGKDLTWHGQSRGGYQFAALLVKPSFKPAATLRALPKVGGDVLAIAKEKPKKD